MWIFSIGMQPTFVQNAHGNFPSYKHSISISTIRPRSKRSNWKRTRVEIIECDRNPEMRESDPNEKQHHSMLFRRKTTKNSDLRRLKRGSLQWVRSIWWSVCDAFILFLPICNWNGYEVESYFCRNNLLQAHHQNKNMCLCFLLWAISTISFCTSANTHTRTLCMFALLLFGLTKIRLAIAKWSVFFGCPI